MIWTPVLIFAFPIRPSPQPWVPISWSAWCLSPFTIVTVVMLMIREMKMGATSRDQWDSCRSHTTWSSKSLDSPYFLQPCFFKSVLLLCVHVCVCTCMCLCMYVCVCVHVMFSVTSLLWLTLMALHDAATISLLHGFPRTSLGRLHLLFPCEKQLVRRKTLALKKPFLCFEYRYHNTTFTSQSTIW